MFFQRTILDSYGVASASNYGHVKIAPLIYCSSDPVDYTISCNGYDGEYSLPLNCTERSKYTVYLNLKNPSTPSMEDIHPYCKACFYLYNNTPFIIRPLGYTLITCCNAVEGQTNGTTHICSTEPLSCIACNILPYTRTSTIAEVPSMNVFGAICNKACVCIKFSYMIEKYVTWI